MKAQEIYNELENSFGNALNSMQNIKTDINSNYDNILNNMETIPFENIIS